MSNETKSTENEPALVIYATPQISITQNEFGDIEIATARIDGDFRNVEHESVYIPRIHAREVAETILALVKPRRK